MAGAKSITGDNLTGAERHSCMPHKTAGRFTHLVFCLLLTSVLCISRSHPITAAHLS